MAGTLPAVRMKREAMEEIAGEYSYLITDRHAKETTALFLFPAVTRENGLTHGAVWSNR